MKLIGTGSFSKVYHEVGSKFVYIRSNDPVKECMANGWFPRSNLFPIVIEADKAGYDYKMKYYEKCSSLKSSLKPKELIKYQNLRNLFQYIYYNSLNCDYHNLYSAFKTIKNKSIRTALLGAIDALSNYGQDIGFEISPRNVAVSPSGNLILLDCFFMQHLL